MPRSGTSNASCVRHCGCGRHELDSPAPSANQATVRPALSRVTHRDTPPRVQLEADARIFPGGIFPHARVPVAWADVVCTDATTRPHCLGGDRAPLDNTSSRAMFIMQSVAQLHPLTTCGSVLTQAALTLPPPAPHQLMRRTLNEPERIRAPGGGYHVQHRPLVRFWMVGVHRGGPLARRSEWQPLRKRPVAHVPPPSPLHMARLQPPHAPPLHSHRPTFVSVSVGPHAAHRGPWTNKGRGHRPARG